MSNPSPLLSLTFRKRPIFSLASMEALIELLPYAALVADVQTDRILIANAKATELSALTRAELYSVSLSDIFPTLEKRYFDKPTSGAGETTFLARRKGPATEVQVTKIILDPKERWGLLALEPVSLLEQREAEQQQQANFLEAFRELALSFQQPCLAEALDMALKAGSSLTGAGLLAIYQANGEDFTLQRSAVLGPAELLPERINPSDLIILQTPHWWSNRKRAVSSLHRAARASNLTCVASAPLGQQNALIGLIVAASDHESQPESALTILKILSSTITAILQSHTLSDNLQQQLTTREKDVSTGAAIKETVHDGVVIIAPDLTILELNASAEAILGYASREVKGWPHQNILVGTDNLIPAFLTNQPGFFVHNIGNVRLYRRDGVSFLANVRTLPVIGEDGLECLIVFIQDLSQEEQYRIRNQQLEQRAVIGEVSAIFAHEVRNPINNLSTGLQLMAFNLPADDPNQEVVARLQQDCDRLEELMKSTLAFVRPYEYKIEPVQLNEALSRLFDRWRPHMARVDIQHSLQIDPNTPPVLGDVRALEQVWNNLISNAIQAMGRDGNLVVKVRPVVTHDNFPQVEVSISDTGPGISDEIRERIFEPFFTTNRNGTGLGLSIARHIISTHRGTINVHSIPGGTSFQVRLPVADQIHTVQKETEELIV